MDTDALQTLWKNGLDRGSFTGETNFRRRTGVSRGILKQQVFPYLSTYTQFRAAKKPKAYNPYFTRLIRKDIQSDLIFMDQTASMVKQNKGYRYILIVQDVFSRKILGRALKNKQSATILNNLRSIFLEMGPFDTDARFIIDRGTEYLNQNVKQLLNETGLTITHPSDGHASHVERANLSLQRLLFQYMMEKGGPQIWTGYLKQAIKNMNNRYHRIIKMSPNKAELPENANKVNEAMALYRQKAIGRKKQKKKFEVGDMVRIQRSKKIFNRGFTPTFRPEVFKIKQILDHLPITMYKLKEWDGTEITGNFYQEELTLVKGDVFKIAKIIRRGIRNGVPSAFVAWEGFAKKYNSWIPITDITNSQDGSV